MNTAILIESRNKNAFISIFSLLTAIFLASIYLGKNHPDEFFNYFGPVAIVCSIVNVVLCWRRAIKADSALVRQASTVETRLDELERLKRRDMITPDEYAAKRQEILKDL